VRGSTVAFAFLKFHAAESSKCQAYRGESSHDSRKKSCSCFRFQFACRSVWPALSSYSLLCSCSHSGQLIAFTQSSTPQPMKVLAACASCESAMGRLSTKKGFVHAQGAFFLNSLKRGSASRTKTKPLPTPSISKGGGRGSTRDCYYTSIGRPFALISWVEGKWLAKSVYCREIDRADTFALLRRGANGVP